MSVFWHGVRLAALGGGIVAAFLAWGFTPMAAVASLPLALLFAMERARWRRDAPLRLAGRMVARMASHLGVPRPVGQEQAEVDVHWRDQHDGVIDEVVRVRRYYPAPAAEKIVEGKNARTAGGKPASGDVPRVTHQPLPAGWQRIFRRNGA